MSEIKRFYMPIEVKTGNYVRFDFPVEIDIDIEYLINKKAASNIAAGCSLKLSENNGTDVPFQYDKGDNILTFLLSGETPANTTRYYQLEVICDGKAINSYGESLIKISNIHAHGFPSWKLTNKNSTLIYDRCGGAFSEMADSDGGDWIQYDNIEPPVCYRGIPNIQSYYGGYNWAGIFHPGYGTVSSRLVETGPLKIKIIAETSLKLMGTDKSAESDSMAVYEIFPDFVRCTVLKSDSEGIAFLYEGVPGGKKFDKTKQYCMNSHNGKVYFSENIAYDISPKWVYFGEDGFNRVLYYAYHEGQSKQEKIYQVFDMLTVFGFGREAIPGITDFPATFTFGFCESDKFAAVAEKVNGLYQPLEIMTGGFRNFI